METCNFVLCPSLVWKPRGNASHCSCLLSYWCMHLSSVWYSEEAWYSNVFSHDLLLMKLKGISHFGFYFLTLKLRGTKVNLRFSQELNEIAYAKYQLEHLTLIRKAIICLFKSSSPFCFFLHSFLYDRDTRIFESLL